MPKTAAGRVPPLSLSTVGGASKLFQRADEADGKLGAAAERQPGQPRAPRALVLDARARQSLSWTLMIRSFGCVRVPD